MLTFIDLITRAGPGTGDIEISTSFFSDQKTNFSVYGNFVKCFFASLSLPSVRSITVRWTNPLQVFYCPSWVHYRTTSKQTVKCVSLRLSRAGWGASSTLGLGTSCGVPDVIRRKIVKIWINSRYFCSDNSRR